VENLPKISEKSINEELLVLERFLMKRSRMALIEFFVINRHTVLAHVHKQFFAR